MNLASFHLFSSVIVLRFLYMILIDQLWIFTLETEIPSKLPSKQTPLH